MSRVNLAVYQPQFYKNSEFMAVINNAVEAELERLQAERDKMKKEAIAETAEDYLEVWERSVALPSDTDLSVSQRQSRVVARLRQMDTTTVERVKIIVEAYANGEVEVTENFSEYTVTVEFVGLLGRPDNMEGIIEQLNRLIPAHLQVNYSYKWRTWGDVLNSGKTWGELVDAGYTWRDLMEREVL